MTEHYNAEPPRRRGATTAQVKGDINSGRTGDKAPGVDPGLSPLGTDDEAGGSTFDPEWIEKTREQELAGRPAAADANAATPELQPNARMGPQRNLILAAVVGVAAAVVLAALLFAVL